MVRGFLFLRMQIYVKKDHRNKKVNMKKTILALLLLTLVIGFAPIAEARIDILPRKIVIDSRERSGELTILNLFQEESTFRMSLLNYRQDENGTYETLETPLNSSFDPANVVRFSPRQFTLTRGGRQKVRLSVRKPADLPEGEYRFHIKALRLAAPPTDGETVSVVANVGVAIPVVVRHGNVEGRASIQNMRLVDQTNTESGKPELHVDIERTGNGSTLGSLDVIWERSGEQPQIIGQISNMNIFTEVSKRYVKIPLRTLPYGSGTVKVVYKNDVKKGEIYDEATLQR